MPHSSCTGPRLSRGLSSPCPRGSAGKMKWEAWSSGPGGTRGTARWGTTDEHPHSEDAHLRGNGILVWLVGM